MRAGAGGAGGAAAAAAAAASLALRFRGKLTVFTVLCEQYQPSLRRDPMYNEVSGAGGPRGRGGRPQAALTAPAPPSTSTGSASCSSA